MPSLIHLWSIISSCFFAPWCTQGFYNEQTKWWCTTETEEHGHSSIEPGPSIPGIRQEMITSEGKEKGLKDCLKECGFDVTKAKCLPVCPFKSQKCYMAQLLSQQEDFQDQPSMLEMAIKAAGHKCLFLPKFHCELNPIEMVRSATSLSHLQKLNSTKYWGWCKYRYRETPKANFAAAK